MKSENNALPWFPITPEYIDQYYESVLKYIRDALESRTINLQEDVSYKTTIGLLFQRVEQIYSEISTTPLLELEKLDSETLKKDIRLFAVSAFLCNDAQTSTRQRYMVMLTFLLALLKPEISDILSDLCLKFVKADRFKSVGFEMEDILLFDIRLFVKKMAKADVDTGNVEKWFDNHGSIKVDDKGIQLYDTSRYLIKLAQDKSSFKAVLTAEDISLLQGKKEAKDFNLTRFLHTVECLQPSVDPIEQKKKEYATGDKLTVIVMNKSYDKVYVQSIDPSYETTKGSIDILSGQNVRGIRMVDIARNVSIGTSLNVYYVRPGHFSIDDVIVDFIYYTFWLNDKGGEFSHMNAILLYPHKGRTRNTWLTEHGFLVRTGFEDIDYYSYLTLKIVGHDTNSDFLLAETTDFWPEEPLFNEDDARDRFMQSFLESQEPILSPAPKKVESVVVEKGVISALHRILVLKTLNVSMGTSKRVDCLSICCAIAAIEDNVEDLDNYRSLLSFSKSLIAFANERMEDVSVFDKKEVEDTRYHQERNILQILKEYGRPTESELIDSIIDEDEDKDVTSIAKLVQASNRFIGSPSLSRLRGALHREICALLNVTDAIVQKEQESYDEFPFPRESESIEHKTSWVFDSAMSLPNETEQSFKVLKTVCAFMNRDVQAGDAHIYIGTNEKRHCITGIQADIDFLVTAGVLTTTGDLLHDEYCRHIMAAIRKRFPEYYQYVIPRWCENVDVLDICVTPIKQNIAYLDGIAYYRSGSDSKEMRDNIKQEILDRKYLLHNEMTDKIDSISRAIQTKVSVILKGYDSSHGNTTGKDRFIEAFQFVDNGRFDAIWAYDYSGTERRNKVFLLKRADGIEIINQKWRYTKFHDTYPLDMFGYYGDEKIPFCIELHSARARNLLLEQYPDTSKYIETLPNDGWQVKGELYNKLSMEAACGFYLSVADDVEIVSSTEFKEFVVGRLGSLVEKL